MFEGVLSRREAGRQSRRRLVTLPAALVVHGAAVAAVAAAQLWTVESVPEPVIMATLVIESPPPPRGDTPSGQREARPASRRARAPHEAGPVRIPDPVPTAVPASSREDEPAAGVPWGLDDGAAAGDDGRWGADVPGPTPSPVQEPVGPVAIGGDVIAPVLVHRIDPVYPEAARIAHRQGDVVVEAVLDRAGNVTDARVAADEVRFGAGEAALQAIRGWRYRPATCHGSPVSVYLTIRVAFRLN